MGTCCATKRQPTLQKTLSLIVEDMSQSEFTIKNPSLKCKSFFAIEYLCTDKNCPAETVFFCKNKTCVDCTMNHSNCPYFKLNSLTQLLQNKCNKHRKLINSITQTEIKMIEDIKKPRLDRIQTMLVSNLPKHYQEIIEYLYFEKAHPAEI